MKLDGVTKVEQLIKFCFVNGRIPNLITVCQGERSSTTWPDPTLPYAEAELMGEATKPRLAYEPETVFVPAGDFLIDGECF